MKLDTLYSDKAVISIEGGRGGTDIISDTKQRGKNLFLYCYHPDYRRWSGRKGERAS